MILAQRELVLEATVGAKLLSRSQNYFMAELLLAMRNSVAWSKVVSSYGSLYIFVRF